MDRAAALLPSAIHDPASTTSPQRWWAIAVAVVIVAATLVAYTPAYRCRYIWDDDHYVTENATLRTASGLRDIWLKPSATPQYYPLVHTDFWLAYHLWGLNPIGFHAANVGLHALNALLLWRILLRLKVPAAEWIALLFALHPVAVESVAWVTERKNVLSMCFYLFAMQTYLRFWPAEDEQPRNWTRYWVALVLFEMALLSKTVTCTLPAALLIIVWWKTGRMTWRRVATMVPMLVMGAIGGIYTAIIERNRVGAFGPEWNQSFLDRVIIAGRVTVFYVAKLLWPEPLIFNYPRWMIDAHDRMQFVYPATVVFALIALWMLRHRIGRGPMALAMLFVASLFPALGFVNVYPMRYSFVADHFQYLAMSVVIIGVVLLVVRVLGANRTTATAGVLVALVLGMLTLRHASVFASETTLWRDTLAKNPQSWMGWYNLAAEMRKAGDDDAAIRMYQRVIELRPQELQAYEHLGMIYSSRHQEDRAVEWFRRAMKYGADDYATLINFATALGRQNDLEGCESIARKAIRLRPQSGAGYTILGQSLAAQGRADDAIAALRKAVDVEPSSAMAHATLAAALANRGEIDDAIKECRAAIAQDAGFSPAKQLLNQLLQASGRPEDQK